MSDTRIIKKYPNRRLYDTAISSYITLADVKRLVLESVDFQVVDAKTREDITRSILLQIISEEEEEGEPIFSSQLLAQLIRAYGGNMQNMLTSYLEKSLELWADQQRVFQQRTREFMDHNPMNIMTQFAERNLALWRQMSGLDGTRDEENSGFEDPPASSRGPGRHRRDEDSEGPQG
ncbi:polyhydroxyalkanoate synthesis repressor PhaR [Halorhodospira halophila]|uniref:Polyhydroxyalkonate synthesis repressor, PhaR n=1 Tax=Halorhodospira halophila (strain DSM 244 / SL1) TaxID=349124 RepID=A1WZ58_HALHL|nr:polyhydroxyalkanoate synthesis repressor PhaR [Halorhodospira halophila]ABM62970.1 polyhydroxyalkonate synthesis repressor, PhaR [Halorhodospira halophila SL1]MBK1727909.1 polyhydroxyalkanoate synthesis repressor PhaR [Halorhodospira halophila]